MSGPVPTSSRPGRSRALGRSAVPVHSLRRVDGPPRARPAPYFPDAWVPTEPMPGGYGAPMGQQISRGELAGVVDSLRRVLGSIDAGELSCSATYRSRLEGAVVALDSLAAGQAEAAASLEVSGDSSAR